MNNVISFLQKVTFGNNISLELSHDAGRGVEAGKSLTGHVVVHLRKKYKVAPRAGAGCLTLIITGKEFTKTTHGGNQSMVKAERQFFFVNLNLHTYYTDTEAGLYTFPFHVQLPTVLPSTDVYPPEKKRVPGYRVEYNMIAKLDRALVERPVVVISAPLPDERIPFQEQPKQHTLRFNGIMDKGTLTVGARVPDTHVGRGDPLHLYVACRNDSTVSIRHVGIKLIETLFWKNTDNLTGTAERVLYDRIDIDVPGLDKERQLRPSRIENSEDTQMLRYQQIYEDLSSGMNRVSFAIPITARDSFKGQLIRVSHCLEVKFQTGMGFTNPRVRINIRIGTPPVRTARPASEAVASFSHTSHSTEEPSIVVTAAIEEMAVAHPPPLPDDEIPIVSATLIPEDSVRAPMVIVPENVMILGGESYRVLDLADLVPLPPPPQQEQQHEPSMQILLEEMSRSVNDYTILADKLQIDQWQQFFHHQVSVDGFGSIIAHVNIDFDQPRVAALLAPQLNISGQGFTCEYALAAIKNSADWIRTTMAERLLPLCTDSQRNSYLIRDELNEWENVISDRFLQGSYEI